MYNTIQTIIIDPISNEISTPVTVNNVNEDVSLLMLVGGIVVAGRIEVEPFKVDMVVKIIMVSIALVVTVVVNDSKEMMLFVIVVAAVGVITMIVTVGIIINCASKE